MVGCRRLIAALAVAFGLQLGVGVVGVAAQQTCTAWAGEIPLQEAVDAADCVEIQAGTWVLDHWLTLTDGKTIVGDPAAGRAQVVLKAGPGWVTNGNEGVVMGARPGLSPVATVRHLTLDADGLATGGIGASDLVVDDVIVRGGRCWGVAIVGFNMSVTNSTIEGNGADAGCPSPPGAGIYVAANGVPFAAYAPRITDNEIRNNVGPGVDIFNVWNGVFERNNVHDNSGWAGVSLFGSSWSIRSNTVTHPADQGGQPYIPSCASGPNGARSSAVMLCQATVADGVKTTGNVISGNTLSSYYGVLLVGNDEANASAVPTANTVSGNTIRTGPTGATVACADDYKVRGKGSPGANTWSGCKPVYF